jgi:hypothetical protein
MRWLEYTGHVLRLAESVPASLRIVLASACIWLGGLAAVANAPSAPSVVCVANAQLRATDAPRPRAARPSAAREALLALPAQWPPADHALEPPAANLVRVLVPDLYLRNLVLRR